MHARAPSEERGIAARRSAGFTLVEVLVTLAILAIVMTILHATFTTSAATARIVEDRADELASLTGALDTMSQELRGAYTSFAGTPSLVTFTAMTAFRDASQPAVLTISYAVEDGTLVRKVFPRGLAAGASRAFTLLDDVKDASFAFFDGRAWLSEWRDGSRLPRGVRVRLSYRGTPVETIVAPWTDGSRRSS